jgi:hypothetical protein
MSAIIHELFHEVLDQDGKISDEDLCRHMRIFVECVHDIALNLENINLPDGAVYKETHDALNPLCSKLFELVETGHKLLDKWRVE